ARIARHARGDRRGADADLRVGAAFAKKAAQLRGDRIADDGARRGRLGDGGNGKNGKRRGGEEAHGVDDPERWGDDPVDRGECCPSQTRIKRLGSEPTIATAVPRKSSQLSLRHGVEARYELR